MSGLSCPRCDAPLASHRIGGLAVDGCQECGGLLVERIRLTQLLERVLRRDPGGPLPRIEDRGAGLSCPLCTTSMDNYGFLAATFVKIDRCRACDLVFVDEGELEAMAVHHMRSKRRADEQTGRTLERLRRPWVNMGGNSVP